MLKAKDVMTAGVITVRGDMTVEALGRLFTEKKISGAPVLDESGSVTGIVTENDLIRNNTRLHIPTVFRIFDALIPIGSGKFEDEIKRMSASTVAEICTTKVVSVRPDSDLQEVSTIMSDRGVHLLPVIENGKLVGIIGKMDVIRGMIGETGQQKPG